MDQGRLDFDEIRERCNEPAQERYESIRLNLLGQASIEELRDYTGNDPRTLEKRVSRFQKDGMLSLFDRRGSKKEPVPQTVEGCIKELLEMFPELGHTELSKIVLKKTGEAVTPRKIAELRKKLSEVQQRLPFPPVLEPQAMRVEVVRLHFNGWSPTSISRYLSISRYHVYRILERFEEEEFAGLADGDKSPGNPARKVHFDVMAKIYQLQLEFPDAGRFRIHGLLKHYFKLEEKGFPEICERTVGRYMEFHRKFYPELQIAREIELSRAKPPTTSHLDYRPTRPHEMWYVDFRHLDTKLDGKVVYSICILEGFSRAVLFGAVNLSKAAWVVLEAFHAAIALFGSPELIISDNEKQFVGKDFGRVCRTLGVERRPIGKRKSFQTLIEPFFGIQRRLADFKFSKAQSFSDFERIHAEFIETYNHTEHWGLIQDGRNQTIPAEALGWLRGQEVEPAALHEHFETIELLRKTDKSGFIKVHNWRLYVEENVQKEKVRLKATTKSLSIEFKSDERDPEPETLAIYPCDFDLRRKKFRDVLDKPQLFDTGKRRRQLHLFYQGQFIPWPKVYQLPEPKPFLLPPKPFTQLGLGF